MPTVPYIFLSLTWPYWPIAPAAGQIGVTFVVMVAVSISSLRGHHSIVGVLISAAFGGATIGALRGPT